MSTAQNRLFPEMGLPFLMEVYPSVVSRWWTHSDPQTRRDAQYLSAYAERVYERILSWSSHNDLLETPRFVSLWFSFWNALEAYTMTRKKPGTDSYNKPEWKGFVERVLTDDELAQCDEWKPKPAELIEALCDLSGKGFDVKISYNAERKHGNVTLIDQRPNTPTTGRALSARGVNCADALKIVVYKHYHLLSEDWTPLLTQAPRTQRG